MNPLGWGLLLAVLLAGWAVLDGAVQGGVQLVRPVGGRDDARRRVVLASVAPFLLLGEVWLVAAVGVLLAAFGHVEATLWRAGYPVVVALIVAWVVRDAGLWLRSRLHAPRWRRAWDVAAQAASVVLPATFGAIAGIAWVQLSAVSAGVTAGLTDVLAAERGSAGTVVALTLGLPVLLAALGATAARVHGGLVVGRRAPEALAAGARRRARTALVPSAALATLGAMGALGVATLGTTSALVGAVALLAAAALALAARFDLDRGQFRQPAVRWAGPVLVLAPVVATASVVGPQVLAMAAPASVLYDLTWPVLGAFAAVLLAQAVSWRVLLRPLGPRTVVFL